jgi:hypothetical protein
MRRLVAQDQQVQWQAAILESGCTHSVDPGFA